MARILVIDDDPKICQLLVRIVRGMGHQADQALTLAAGLSRAVSGEFDVIFLDLTLPDGHGLSILPDLLAAPSSPEVVIVTGTGDQSGAELAFKHGAWDFVAKPFLPEEVALPLTRALQYREQKKSQTKPKVLRREGIIGDSQGIRTCLELVAQAAAVEGGVLITGETGTGKELFARAIHQNSRRAGGNFVVVDCGALPETLVESTLFGHEKGAFTGADRAGEGLIKQADRGTLFLDEIGELPISVQKAFLRVLQEHRFRPVGSSREISSDFRLVAATNRDLDQMAVQGLFRSDLLYRVRSLTIHLPPLRERPQDIKDLVIHQITKSCQRYGLELKGFSPEFLEILANHDWPGNVRELLNTIEQALAAAGDSPTLYPKDLPVSLRLKQIRRPDLRSVDLDHASTDGLDPAEGLPSLPEYRESVLQTAEKEYLLELMRRTKGKIKEACRISGLSESRLHALLKKYQTPRFRSD